MYARLVLFTLGPGTRETAEGLIGQFDPLLRAREGFVDVKFLADDEVGEYGAVVLWESKETAEAAVAQLEPQLEGALSGIAQGPPTLQLYEVIEP